MTKLSIQERCNLAEAHENFDALLDDTFFWRRVILDNDNGCVNAVCRYVFEHSSLVSEIFIDNVASPEATFITLWIDIILSALSNVRKVTVLRSTFLTSGLFISGTPLLTELRLQSCPNLSAFTLTHGFVCTRPPMLKVLDITGVPGLNEQTAVQLATSCKALEQLDMSGAWGPLLCMTCVQRVIRGCPKLSWFNVSPYIPQSPVWEDVLTAAGGVENRVVQFGPYITRIVAANKDIDL